MEKNIAIIDLGTNTFHMLITRVENRESFGILKRLKLPVKLGSGGMQNNLIAREAYARGLEALVEFRELLDEYQVVQTRIIGTSFLRNASNAGNFIADAEEIVKNRIEVIDGDKEAELIYYGVRWAVGMWEEPSLIVDIGGGSVEFIIANKYRVFWKKSYEIGAARMIQMFPHDFPIRQEETDSVRKFLEEELEDLLKVCNNYRINALMGASGSFETYTLMEIHTFLDINTDNLPLMHPIQMENFFILKNRILSATREELHAMPGMAAFRVEMIVVSTLLMEFIITRLDLRKLYFSEYALKEGTLWEILNTHYND